MSEWYYYERTRPLRPKGGIAAKTAPGKKFGTTWWGSRWIAALERLVDAGRLQRGRSYARAGQVVALDVAAGRVSARVQGSRPTPYKVSIAITPLAADEWDRVTAALAEQAIFAAKLLAGEMPQHVEEAFAAAGVSLFPAQSSDLDTDCTCPDWANPCKHVAAVYYLLGERFDADPFLLFELRGRSGDAIATALREMRAMGAAPEPADERTTAAVPVPSGPPLDAGLDRFWEPSAALEGVRPQVAAPDVDAVAAKRLGPPPFWPPKPPFADVMSQTYATISRAALDVVGGDGSTER